jgi:hypothetical protein
MNGRELRHRKATLLALIKLNEMLWIFFGVYTANTARIAKRLAQQDLSLKIS